MWCWGNAGGIGWIDGVTTTNASTPIRAGTTAFPVTDAVAISVSENQWCAARAAGGVVCMGDDLRGTLGNGPVVGPDDSPQVAIGLP